MKTQAPKVNPIINPITRSFFVLWTGVSVTLPSLQYNLVASLSTHLPPHFGAEIRTNSVITQRNIKMYAQKAIIFPARQALAPKQDGTAIPNITNSTTWYNDNNGAYCWYNNNENLYKSAYGALYNWHAAGNSHGLCPQGWHVPSEEEWRQLDYNLGLSQSEVEVQGWRGTNEGGKLKETGTL